MSRSTIYWHEWVEPVNSWKYRLEIIPADTTEPEEWVYEQIGLGINELSDLAAKFDKVPIGAANADGLKINFDLNKLPTDLKTYLTQPSVATWIDYGGWGIEYGDGTFQFTYSKIIDVSNLLIFKTDKGSGGAVSHIMFVGTQKKSIPASYEITFITNSAEYEFISLGKVVLEMINAQDIWNRLRQGVYNEEYVMKTAQYAYDLLIADANVTGGFFGIAEKYLHHQTGYGFYYSIDDIDDAIMSIATMIFLKFYRQDAAMTIYGNPFISMQFFTRDSSHDVREHGAMITTSDLYILGTAAPVDSNFYDEQVYGFFVDEKDGHTFYKYGNNAYNYYKALADGNGCKMSVSTCVADNTTQLRFIKFLATSDAHYIKFTDATSDKIKFDTGCELIRAAQSELSMVSDSDTHDYTSEITGSLSENDYSVNPVFHNLPTIEDTTAWTINNDEGIVKLISPEKTFSTSKLYYVETIGGNELMVKVHEHVRFGDLYTSVNYYDSPDAEDLAILNSVTLWGNLVTIKNVNAYIIALQQASNSVQGVCDYLKKIFGNVANSVWEDEFLLDEYLLPDRIGNTYYLDNSDRFIPHPDATALAATFSFLPEKAILMDSSVNIAKGIVKVKYFLSEGLA